MSSQSDQGGVTGDTVLEAQFDPTIIPYLRWYVSGILLITVAGIPLIPFWLIVSAWYGREFIRRLSARLTTQALEIRKGVFFRRARNDMARLASYFTYPYSQKSVDSKVIRRTP